MTQAPQIAIVDDDKATRETVADYLKLHGFEVAPLSGGQALREALAKKTPDLIVLDLNMPEEDGLSIIRSLKEKAVQVPIIMLTATASPIDRIVGLELGADDYIAKPAELRELVARIRSVLRRAAAQAAAREAPAQQKAQEVRFGTRWLNMETRHLRGGAEGEVLITASEFNLLKAFAENPNRVLSRERLLDLANARDPDAFDRAIDVRVTRIRKKIEPDPANPKVIRTIRGAGYMFVPDGDRE
ncbi:response regulator [Prosthecomicrobium sp. N25]|uniref:response regulator n=1 Tax=Prosthecomicrobium sp. N25 TaxID=3129254 RepID=UPI003077E558